MCRYIQMKLRITFLLYDTARQQQTQHKKERVAAEYEDTFSLYTFHSSVTVIYTFLFS